MGIQRATVNTSPYLYVCLQLLIVDVNRISFLIILEQRIGNFNVQQVIQHQCFGLKGEREGRREGGKEGERQRNGGRERRMKGRMKREREEGNIEGKEGGRTGGRKGRKDSWIENMLM